MPKISSVVTAAFLAYAASTAEGFAPLLSNANANANDHHHHHHSTVSSRTNSALHVSVVSSFLTKEEADSKVANVFERETPSSVGVEQVTKQQQQQQQQPRDTTKNNRRRRNKNNRRRKHNFSANPEFRHAQPDTDFYTLHSSAVSHLHKDMPMNDITRAIKRAQNLHDAHDLATIAAFLIDECDDWGYGFRGSLLSRTAVAALHMSQVDIARRAIDTRRNHERESMQPYESAAMVRGLMRAGQIDLAWEVLEDELGLPSTLTNDNNSMELLKHRAHVLASIVSRHFYNGEPQLATRALECLSAMGVLLEELKMTHVELQLPWSRLVNAATDCQFNPEECSVDLPSDLSELVFEAITAFPCPGGEEECGLDDYLFDD
ncbi:unnamed protein product [Cylindrotheca closterium]|uniref:Uncharacterized protein n=1 Tax=Cylindrotheca closterium TaxID=2856 RepID=A0AAD2CKA2_9STRA|nr:unnamed protein product [Cylindrotheca closterium]